MAATITPFLMFEGRAEEAIRFYLSVFEDSAVEQFDRFGVGEGPGDGVKYASVRLAGRTFRFIDSAVSHEFTFTPAMSLFVDLDSPAAVDQAFAQLSEGGAILMPLDEYPFNRHFGWVNDQFGVSWQLGLDPG